jgi:CheY-like chemotaxis protein
MPASKGHTGLADYRMEIHDARSPRFDMTDDSATRIDGEAPGRGPRVLLVEDETMVRDMVRTFLERAGYQVVALASAEEAMAGEYLEATDLLLTDVMLRGKTGVELAATLREQRPNLKVVYMSGSVADQATRESVVSPDARFLAKPFTRTMLLETVRSLAGTGRVAAV